jgi:hypothetical protein
MTIFADARKQAAIELRAALAHHTGSHYLYRNVLAPAMTYTDGARCFADTAGAWWLLDHLLIDPRYKREAIEHGLVFITLTVDEQSRGRIVCVRDSGEAPLVTHAVRYTDCPPGDWAFYLQDNGQGGATLMLPREY